MIFCTGSVVSALAAKSATKTIPIVFANGSDPVKYGLVESLNRPGGNMTGVMFYNSGLGPKRIELLRQLMPSAAAIGLLVNPNNPNAEDDGDEITQAGRTSASASRSSTPAATARSTRCSPISGTAASTP